MVRFSRREKISHPSLREAVARADRGLIDADLGGGLIKQRVARQGKGRSGGYRMIVAYRRGDRAFFLYGFAKSERANIGPDELKTVREIGAVLMAATEDALARKTANGELEEVDYGREEA
jgi:hypothetical protein